MDYPINKDKLFYILALNFTTGIGPITARKLLDYFNEPSEIFKNNKELHKLKLLNSNIATTLNNKENFYLAEKELNYIEKNNIKVLYYKNADYPYRLKLCNDAPPLIFYKGNVNFNGLKVISIVGTRKATEYGKSITRDIVLNLKNEPITIVSGLAIGIDSIAHRAAIEANLPTIAVLGNGFHTIYPGINYELSNKILENGAIITEFPYETKPDKENFPRRNRIIAGLSDAVIVAEARKTGGALITAELAISYNRDVFAIPGRTIDKCSEGCNWLIKSNKASLICNAEDLYNAMNWQLNSNNKQIKQQKLPLSEDEEKIIQLLNENGEMNIDAICNKTNFTLSKLATILLNLEMYDIIKSLPGKYYRLK